MSETKIELLTELSKYPCPACGEYNKPYMINSKGKAIMFCKKHGTYETSIKVSKHFRKICSKIGRKPNRSQTYYTSLEKQVKSELDKKGLIEGIDYIHNVRIRDPNRKGVYFWLDFYLPRIGLVIECSPSLWHQRWSRDKSDSRKISLLESYGLKVLIVPAAKEIESVVDQIGEKKADVMDM